MGTVTFLFTDIEGSTRLLHQLGTEAYAHALAEHRGLLREVFARHGGVVVDAQGDAFFVAFSSAPAALAAAGDAQEALSASRVRVRMGLHTGIPHITAEGYVGADVHKGARIAAAGHGGQVLMSKATRELVAVELTDLGEHHLKDFADPEWIFQAGRDAFPPLRTISNTNLPHPVSSFVGREKEVAAVASLLRDGARLVTLTGPGGSGKTRLAIEAAAELVVELRNGVFWVGLGVLRDPALVGATVAQVLGAKAGLAEHIGEREMLLLLDNFEQVVEAAPDLSELLEACPGLRLLVTSRELLRLRGEVEYPVLPLAEADAVALFCARGRCEPDAAVGDLCRRLDNLPLAVELAAARTSVLWPAQILARLTERLDLLKAGRGVEARQRTLRATIEWSHQLLDESERRLFARLAVFAGGCTLEAAEAVARANLDVLQSLVDKNLLRHAEERFWMLETIREYALERMHAGGEEDEVRSRHQAWFVSLVERSEPELAGPLQHEIGRRMEREFGNVREAFAWSLATGDIDAALRLVTNRRFWQFLQAHAAEGLAWIDDVLSQDRSADPSLHARALVLAGDFRRVKGDLGEARSCLEKALAMQRDLSDGSALGQTLYVLGRVESSAGHNERAHEVTVESVAIARTSGDRQVLGERLAQLGEITYDRAVPEDARPLLEEGLRVGRAAGDAHTIADSLRVLGMIERDADHPEVARSFLGEALTIQRGLSDWYCASLSLSVLGDLALRAGQPNDARTYFAEALSLQRDIAQWYRMADSLWGLAAATEAQGRLERAAALLGAEEVLRQQTRAAFRLARPERHDAVLRALRDSMEEAALNAAWHQGCAMGHEEALAFALNDHLFPNKVPPAGIEPARKV